MRTNIDIDDETLALAMRAGAFKTKKDAVEAGLKLLARQAAFKELLALRGKLQWDDAPAATALLAEASAPRVADPSYKAAALPNARPSRRDSGRNDEKNNERNNGHNNGHKR